MSIRFTKIRAVNFRCFADTGDVELRPLTLLVGPNSSGKTAFLHTFILLYQSAGRNFTKFFVPDEPFLVSEPKRLLWDKNNKDIQLELTISGRKRKGRAAMFATLSTRLSLKGNGFESSVQPDTPAEFLNLFDKMGLLVQLGIDKPLTSLSGPVQQFLQVLGWASLFKRYLFWLGPLREKPKGIYETRQTEFWVGPNGEWFAAVLQAHWRKAHKFIERWLDPNGGYIDAGVSLSVVKEAEEAKKVKGQRGVTVWLIDRRYGGGKPGPGSRRLPPEVGFGVSQVMPVLVQGAVAPEGSLLLFEQPELHLHPTAQVAMGQVLADMAGVLRTGATRPSRKTIVAETHSELVLLRVGRLIAEDKLSPKDVVIYFFRPDSQKGTVLHKIEFDEDGKLQGDVPQGFFAEAFAESRAHADAVMEKRGCSKGVQQ